jgi:Zn-dependent peptidase ImmA (M78 family)
MTGTTTRRAPMGGGDDPVAALVAAADRVELRGDELRGLFERFVTLGRKQAALEALVLGAVPLSFPAHLLEGATASDDPLAQGAALAGRESERLGLTPGLGAELERTLQDEGVKVIALPFPDGSGLLGAFVFDGAIGPALLVDAAAPPRLRGYAMAHGYGHFLADNDPYRAFACRASGGATDSPAELRAHGFAGALHVPPDALKGYLDAAGVAAGDPIEADLLRQLRVYFEADDRALLGALLAAGRIRRSDIAGLLVEAGADAAGEPPTEAGFGALPAGFSKRHILLAVMAYRAGHHDLAALARQLEIDPATAAHIERQFQETERTEHGDRST